MLLIKLITLLYFIYELQITSDARRLLVTFIVKFYGKTANSPKATGE